MSTKFQIELPSQNSPYFYIYDHFQRENEDELKRICSLTNKKLLDELIKKFNDPEISLYVAKTIRKSIAEALNIPIRSKKIRKIKKKDSSVASDFKLEKIEEVDESEEVETIFLGKESTNKIIKSREEIDKWKEQFNILEKENQDLKDKINQLEKDITSSNTLDKNLLTQDLVSSIYMSSNETFTVNVNRLLLTMLVKHINSDDNSSLKYASENFISIYQYAVNCAIFLYLKQNSFIKL